MEEKFLNFKREIEKINLRIKSIFEKNKIFSKLENHNQKMLATDFWKDKNLSKKS